LRFFPGYVEYFLRSILIKKNTDYLVRLKEFFMGKGFLSYAAAAVLQAVASGYQYGFDIIDITGLPGGTVYPALRRLEGAGFVTSKWEKHSIAQAEQRPPRKYYEMTRAGHEALAEAVKRYRLLEQTLLDKKRDQKPSRA
jgi:DNA-binding PadR family transcriptional regulator